MNRTLRVVATAVALTAAAGGGYLGGRPDLWPFKPPNSTVNTPAAKAKSSGEIVYYHDPEGKPHYSLTPKATPDGRGYLPVRASEDVNFETLKDEAVAPVGRKIKFYRNPMGLPDTSPAPKKDSMGMNYIPVYEGEDSVDGSIKLSPGKLQRTGVKSAPATLRVISTVIKAPGAIQLDERRVAVISMRAETWVEKVEDVTTGAFVRKGQPLMRVYSPALTAAAADYVAVMNGSPTALPLNRGAKQRLLNLDVPETTIALIEKNRAAPLVVMWTAPRDGIVIERNAIDGMRAEAGDVLFRLADTAVVWGLVDIAERDLGGLKVGQTVTVRARSYPGRDFAGTITVIYPQINRETRTARARIELANPDTALLPDMYVDGEIAIGSTTPLLAVPESAVIDTGTRQALFIDKGNGKLEPRDVKLGARGGGYVEIREGLKEGEAVVESANFLIDAESNLKAALKGFGAAEAPQ